MTVRFHDALHPLLVDTDEVRPHPDNAKNGDTDAIVASMRKNGVYRPVMAQRSTGYVLAGNHTYAALLELGAEKVPVVWLDVDVDEARRIMLADNRTADLGRMDDGLLLQLLQALPDLEGTGYSPTDLDDLAALMDDSAWADDVSQPDGGDHDEDDFRPRIDLRVSAEVFDAWQRWLNDGVEGKDDAEKLGRRLRAQGFLTE